MAKKKQPSGAAKRRRAYEKAEAAAKLARSSKPSAESAPAAVPAPFILAAAQSYADIGPPPADGLARVDWAQKMLAAALYETAIDPEIEAGARRRIIGDLGAKIGITAVKALFENRFKKLEDKVYGRSTKGRAHAAREDGLEEVD